MQRKSTALDKALRSLAVRAHSERELVDKLTRAGYTEKEIAEAMASLAKHELLDDTEFSVQWAASRARRGLGAYRIATELRQKGIDRDTADEALSQIDENVMLENATALAEKHFRRGGDNAKRRAYDALIRRGFGYGIARQAVENAALSMDAESDE